MLLLRAVDIQEVTRIVVVVLRGWHFKPAALNPVTSDSLGPETKHPYRVGRGLTGGLTPDWLRDMGQTNCLLATTRRFACVHNRAYTLPTNAFKELSAGWTQDYKELKGINETSQIRHC